MAKAVGICSGRVFGPRLLNLHLFENGYYQGYFEELAAKAKASPRLRCNLDHRNSANDQSQRMLNALEPGTGMPIHRHKGSSETCICIRGHFEEYF